MNSLCYRLERVWDMTESRGKIGENKMHTRGARIRQLERPFRFYPIYIGKLQEVLKT